MYLLLQKVKPMVTKYDPQDISGIIIALYRVSSQALS
jgi:hypothetical protein